VKQKVGDVVTFSYDGQEMFRFKIIDMVVWKEDFDDSAGHWAWTYTLQLLEDFANPEVGRQLRLAYWVATPKTGGYDRFGQYAPTLNEQTLLELMRQAIEKRFFSSTFVHNLKGALTDL